jgi:hypothetical protein
MSKAISLGLAVVISTVFVSPQTVAFHPHQEASQKRGQPASPPQAAKQCGPGVAGTLFLVGLSFATKSTALLRRPLPCAVEPQEVRQKPRVLEVRKQATEYRLAKLPVAEALREARMLYIRKRSSRFNSEKLERELLKRKEFAELGLELTRNADRTDLVLEITRKRFTTRFTCSIIEPGSERVLAATTASSLGGEIEPHLAEAILNEFKAARGKSATEEKK